MPTGKCTGRSGAERRHELAPVLPLARERESTEVSLRGLRYGRGGGGGDDDEEGEGGTEEARRRGTGPRGRGLAFAAISRLIADD